MYIVSFMLIIIIYKVGQSDINYNMLYNTHACLMLLKNLI